MAMGRRMTREVHVWPNILFRIIADQSSIRRTVTDQVPEPTWRGRVSPQVRSWLLANAIALVLWLLIAWRIWPWPDYASCDFPVSSWRFLFSITPGLITLAHLVFGPIILVFLAGRRQFVAAFSIAITALLWFGLAMINFNPDANPGDGCYEGIDLPLPEKGGFVPPPKKSDTQAE